MAEVQTQEAQEAQERLDITLHHQLYLFRQDRLALHWKWQWAVADRAVVQGVEHRVEPTGKARQDIQVEKEETLDHNHTQDLEVAAEGPHQY